MNYSVVKIPYAIAKEHLIKHHYTHGVTNGGISYGLYDPDRSPPFTLFPIPLLIGVIAFCNPISERVKMSIFGPTMKKHVTELTRLHVLDITPTNTESYFISRALKLLKKDQRHIKAVVTYADPTAGHNGTIYRATNAIELNKSKPTTSYYDNGRIRSARQNSVNYSEKELKRLGWVKTMRESKFKFVYLLGDRREKRQSMKILKQVNKL